MLQCRHIVEHIVADLVVRHGIGRAAILRDNTVINAIALHILATLYNLGVCQDELLQVGHRLVDVVHVGTVDLACDSQADGVGCIGRRQGDSQLAGHVVDGEVGGGADSDDVEAIRVGTLLVGVYHICEDIDRHRVRRSGNRLLEREVHARQHHLLQTCTAREQVVVIGKAVSLQPGAEGQLAQAGTIAEGTATDSLHRVGQRQCLQARTVREATVWNGLDRRVLIEDDGLQLIARIEHGIT